MAGVEEECETAVTVRKEDGAKSREGKERKPEEPYASDSRFRDYPHSGVGQSPARRAPSRLSSHPQNVVQKLGNIQQQQSGAPLLVSHFPDWKEK